MDNKTETYDKNYYSLCHNEYRKHFYFQISALFRAFYMKLIFNPERVLDVGCGMGNLVEMLHQLGIEALGVDISEHALAKIPSKIKRFCQKGSALRLEFPSKSFDLVSTVNVLEHIREKEVELAIKECARVARWAMYHEITVSEDIRTIDKDPTHETKRSTSWWCEVFKKLSPWGWRVKKGPSIPVFKNGIFLLERR